MTPPAALWRAVAVGCLLLGVLVAMAGGVVALFDDDTATAALPQLGPQGRSPQFKVECAWSHAAADDPIVAPGRPGRSHLHDFFGNTTTSADSTVATLHGGGTTCQNQLDTAAFWVPALLRRGAPVRPIGSAAYYRPGPGIDAASVRPYPAGLMMIGGDHHATVQPLEVAAWHCGASPVLHANPPACPRTAPLGVRVAFPDCWDGRHLDSDDHRSHMARSRDGRCPSDHPVPVPQLIFEVHYPVSGDPAGLELASGGVRGVHADFLNAWDEDALAREVRACLNGGHVCGVVSNRATG